MLSYADAIKNLFEAGKSLVEILRSAPGEADLTLSDPSLGLVVHYRPGFPPPGVRSSGAGAAQVEEKKPDVDDSPDESPVKSDQPEKAKKGKAGAKTRRTKKQIEADKKAAEKKAVQESVDKTPEEETEDDLGDLGDLEEASEEAPSDDKNSVDGLDDEFAEEESPEDSTEEASDDLDDLLNG